jgi:phosphoribosylaminoimidazole-succinocarboxamide synthase
MAKMVGRERAEQVRDTAIALYQAAAAYALDRGIIIADTKFEFGVDEAGRLVLIDEALTPDSSRFWPLDTWKEGASPESFDKQYVRNWLDSIGFKRTPPAPAMPAEVAARTSQKYQEALNRLVG